MCRRSSLTLTDDVLLLFGLSPVSSSWPDPAAPFRAGLASPSPSNVSRGVGGAGFNSMASHTGSLAADIMVVVVDAVHADADEGKKGDDDVDGPGNSNGSSEDGLDWPELRCCCWLLFLLVISTSISHKEPVRRRNTVDRKGNIAIM